MRPISKFIRLAGWGFGLSLTALATQPATAVQVQVAHTAGWAQGDTIREGAAEFMVLMQLARLERQPLSGGLVGVGDRRGLFGAGVERAMEHAARRGVPIVKLAPNGRVLNAPHGLFLDGTGLSEVEACALLERCLALHGRLPVVGPDAAGAQLAPLLARLQVYQREFTLAAGTRLAAR